MTSILLYRSVLIACLFIIFSVQLSTNYGGHDDVVGVHQLEFYEKVLRLSEKIERSPRLKAEWNRRLRKERDIEINPPEFTCNVTNGRSQERPTSVHQLRPGDIDVVAAFGDSISAGNGLAAETLVQVIVESRGEVWSIGGDLSLEEGVVTLPNILRKFNPQLKGYSSCASHEEVDHKAWFNVARPGATCDDMPKEAEMLVERMKLDPRVNFTHDWKMLTMFVGGNDVCISCHPGRNYTGEAYYAWFEQTLVYLEANLNRTLINLVTMLDPTTLSNFSTGLVCDLLQWGFCDCVRNSTTWPTIRPLQLSYHDQFVKLANDPRFKREDFTVVVQPHMRDMKPPTAPNGSYLDGFLSPDCFHPNRVSHQSYAMYLWNTMLIPVGQKPFEYAANEEASISCPTEEQPYIFTDGNSASVSLHDHRMYAVV